MTEQTMWMLFVIVAAIVAAALGFWAGRRTGGAGRRIADLEQEVAEKEESLNHYKQDVREHFDRTAALFATMAGSYKDLFEHLSHGYENLTGGSARELMRAQVDTMLEDAGVPTGALEREAPRNDSSETPVSAAEDVLAVRSEPQAEAMSPAENLPVIEGEAVVEEVVSRPAAAVESFRVEDDADAELPLVTDVVPEVTGGEDRREPSIVADEAKEDSVAAARS